MNQQSKRIKNIVFKNLDSIYTSCKTVAKAWDSNSISLAYLEETIKAARPKDLDITPELIKFMGVYDTTLETLLKLCQNKATAMDKKSIPMKYLKECLNRVKKSFKTGLSN